MLEYALRTGVPHLLDASVQEADKSLASKQKSRGPAEGKQYAHAPRGRKRQARREEGVRPLNETSQNVQRTKKPKQKDETPNASGSGSAEKVARAPPAAFKLPPTMNLGESIGFDDSGELDYSWPASRPMPYVASRSEYDADDGGHESFLVPLSIPALGLIAAPISNSQPKAQDIRAKRLARFDNSGCSKAAAGHTYEDAIILD